LTDKKIARSIVQKAKNIEEKAKKMETNILAIVRRKI
jgi:hypothetical protein